MIRALIIIFSILISINWLGAQTYFLRSYDFGSVEYIYQIIEYNDRIFINTATRCGLECSFLSEVDLNGNIVWRTEIPDIDIAQGTLVIVNDTITVTGNNDHDNESFQMAHFTLEGQKIGETIKIDHPTKKFTRMFQLTTQFFNDKYIICGAGKLANDAHCSIFYSVYKDGTLDTLVILDTASHRSEIWDSFVDSQGQLNLFLWLEEDEPGFNFRKILKLGENFDILWTYQTENSNSNLTVPRGCELLNGHTVLSYINPEDDPFLHSIRSIDSEGELNWQYDYQWTGSRTREIYRLKTLQNGDIMGSGVYSEYEQNPRIGDSPWLFRISPEGDLLWEHVYYDFDSTLNQNGSSRLGTLLDFVELSNGDILAVGNIRYDDSDMLVLRVDSNGCLYPKNCPEVNILTSKDRLFPPTLGRILVYPNPIHEFLYVEFVSPHNNADFAVRDLLGNVLLFGTLINGKAALNASELGSGVYLVSIMQDGRDLGTNMFLKI